MWLSQCSNANSREVETTDTWTELRVYGCGTKAVTKAMRRMRLRSSRNERSTQRRSSRTTKAMVKAVRKVHRWCSRTEERMQWRSSCTDDRGTKAVAKGVRKTHLWLWNKGSEEGRNKALDSAPTREGWSMTKPPRLWRQQLRGGDDGYANKAMHLRLWNEGSKCDLLDT